MSTRIVRRLYIYGAAFVGLWMMAGGFRALCMVVLERWLGAPAIVPPEVAALELAASIALVVVGIPFWAIHWSMARHDAREPEGQHAALRRLYGYAVLLIAALTAMSGLHSGLALVLEGAGHSRSAIEIVAPFVGVAVSAVVWAAHWHIFAADRELVERTPPNATLRRWYLALTLWASLAMSSFGAGLLIHGLLQRFVFHGATTPQQLSEPTAALIAGLAVWLPHELWSRRLAHRPGPLQADEVGSALRQVYMALVVVASLVAGLTGLATLIAAGLRAALGVGRWGSMFAAETLAAGAVAVALPLVLYHWRQLVATAQVSGSVERAATTRRMLGYLLSAVSLVALYFGLGGLIGTLARHWLGGVVAGEIWRTSLSWFAAASIVALPVYWLATAHSEALARSSAEEESTLARRIYLYAALLFGVIAVAVTATSLVRLLVMAVLGAGGPGVAGEIGRMLGYAVLGGLITAAYSALVRRASAVRGRAGEGRMVVLVAHEPLARDLRGTLAHELPGAAIVTFPERDSPERRAAVAGADLLIVTLASLSDPALGAFAGPQLALATPVEGVSLVGARREGAALAREAARKARELCLSLPPAPQPQASATLTASPA